MADPDGLEGLSGRPEQGRERPLPLYRFIPTLRHAFRNPIFPQHLGRLRWVGRLAPGLKGLVLDIGCGQRLFDKWYTGARRLVSTDLAETSPTFKGVSPDAWADATALPFGDGIFDGATSWEVIEHMAEPEKLLREAWRVLKPGGRLLLSTPLTAPLHGMPYDYYRWTPNGLRVLSEKNGFRVLGVYPISGLIGVAAYFVSLSIFEIVGRGNHVVEFLLRPFFGTVAILGILLDELIRHDVASIAYVAVLERRDEGSAGAGAGPEADS